MTAEEKRIYQREYNRQYRKAHPEKEKEHHRKYRENNLEKVRASNKKWREDNPEKAKENIRRWREKNPERAMLSDRRWGKNHPKASAARVHKSRLKAWGLTVDDYDKMLSDQNGVCAICGGINKNGKRLSIDHNHESGKHRGLLCSNCNTGIGMFSENINSLTAAISYLMEWDNGYEKTESNLDATASI